MALQILPQDPGSAGNIGSQFGTGLGQGLQALAQQRMQDVQNRRRIPALQSIGYTEDEAKGILNLDPSIQRELVKQKMQSGNQESYAKALRSIVQDDGQIGQDEIKSLTPQQATDLTKLSFQQQEAKDRRDQRLQERKSKIRSEYTPLENASTGLEELKDLANNPKTNFGATTSITANLPGEIGKQYLNEETSNFFTLANKVVIDSLQNAKGVRGQYLAKLYEKAKPSLAKTREQNLKDIDVLLREINKSKENIKEDNPWYFKDKETSIREIPGETDIVEKFDPKTNQWRRARKKDAS